jgi:hypothetical protein
MFDDYKIPSGYWYLATPYSKYPGGLTEAFVAACRLTAKLIKNHIPVRPRHLASRR